MTTVDAIFSEAALSLVDWRFIRKDKAPTSVAPHYQKRGAISEALLHANRTKFDT